MKIASYDAGSYCLVGRSLVYYSSLTYVSLHRVDMVEEMEEELDIVF